MKSIRYDDWKKQRRTKFKTAVAVENSFNEPYVGQRPRDPEKERILIRLEKARRDRLIRSGKIEIIGPRKWRWNISFRQSLND
jgi:hypothetical protein